MNSRPSRPFASVEIVRGVGERRVGSPEFGLEIDNSKAFDHRLCFRSIVVEGLRIESSRVPDKSEYRYFGLLMLSEITTQIDTLQNRNGVFEPLQAIKSADA